MGSHTWPWWSVVILLLFVRKAIRDANAQCSWQIVSVLSVRCLPIPRLLVLAKHKAIQENRSTSHWLIGSSCRVLVERERGDNEIPVHSGYKEHVLNCYPLMPSRPWLSAMKNGNFEEMARQAYIVDWVAGWLAVLLVSFELTSETYSRLHGMPIVRSCTYPWTGGLWHRFRSFWQT